MVGGWLTMQVACVVMARCCAPCARHARAHSTSLSIQLCYSQAQGQNGTGSTSSWGREQPGGQGAVLIFLPGVDDILKISDVLALHAAFCDPVRYAVLPLHGQLRTFEQRRVFERSPAGVRKFVLATNIAETAIMVDDVVYVVNTGRMKEMRF
jgi:HrpA-like RNA helicase